MDERGYKEQLRNMILEMAQKELETYVSQKGMQKYFEGNVDKVINENLKKVSQGIGSNKEYHTILKNSAHKKNISSVAKAIRAEDKFKTKNELVKFAKYLGVDVNTKSPYNQILRRVSTHIYHNKNEYSNKYFFYKRGEEEYLLEPEKLKEDLIERYKSKARNDMRSISKLLNIKIDENDGAEEIRKKVINYIMKEKLYKNK